MLRQTLIAMILCGAWVRPDNAFADDRITAKDIEEAKEAIAAFTPAKDGELERKKLFPLIVPDGYLKPPPNIKEPPVSVPLLRGLQVALAVRREPGEVPGVAHGLFQYVRASDLAEAKLTIRDAFQIAVDNLATSAEKGELRASVAVGSDRKPKFVIWSGTMAASCVLLPGVHKMAAAALQTDEIIVAIPHREACLLFPAGGSMTLEQTKSFVSEHEGAGRKPVTADLFRLVADAKKPFFERAPIARVESK